MAKKGDSKKAWAIISIILGILVIAVPQIIALTIGLYLIITGILSLADKK